MSNQPWFIDALDRMVDEFYPTFQDELAEQMFIATTEMSGPNNRTPHEAAEEINRAIHGKDMQKICDDEYDELQYDEFFMQNCDLTAELMTRMIRKFAEEY